MPALTPAEISAIDAAHVWHPYSTIGAEAHAAASWRSGASGAWLTLIDDGEPVEVLDAMSSWWTAIHGHGHPALDDADHRPARHDEPRHVRRAHPRAGRPAGPAAGARSRPTGWTPSSSATPGSVSVEVAVKMALQYWRSRGRRRSTG